MNFEKQLVLLFGPERFLVYLPVVCDAQTSAQSGKELVYIRPADVSRFAVT